MCKYDAGKGTNIRSSDASMIELPKVKMTKKNFNLNNEAPSQGPGYLDDRMQSEDCPRVLAVTD